MDNYLSRTWPKTAVLIFCLVLILTGPFSTLTAKKAKRITSTSPELRMQYYKQHMEMLKATPYKKLAWQYIGPKNVSGRIVDVAVAKRKGKTSDIYVASASGGLWKTSNTGITWVPVFDHQGPSTACGDVEVDPSNPDIVWLGTGEANIFRSSQAGNGIYKSGDAGKTWKHMGLTDTNTIARIIVHPGDSNIVYVAASGHEWTNNRERGLYKTVDGGANWKKVLYINEKTGVIDLVMDPVNPDILYAATWQRIRKKWNDPRTEKGYTGSGIHKTTDGGKTWKPINKGLPAADKRGRIGIDIARSNPKVVYAFVDNYEFATIAKPGEVDSYGRPKKNVIKGATLYRSDDSGQSWVLMSGKTKKMKQYMMYHSATYGWVFGQMRVDPRNENRIYTMGLRLNVSDDAGRTFRRLDGMHADHHALWIDPDNTDHLINCNDGGVVESFDTGKNWRHFIEQLPLCQFFNINYDMDAPFRVYGSMQDHGSYRGIVDISKSRKRIPAQDFERAPGFEGNHHAVDPTNPKIVYAATFYGMLNRADYSRPGNSRWRNYHNTVIMPKLSKGDPPHRGQWVAHFILSPHNPKVIYHGLQYIYRSMHMGDNFERISPDLTNNNKKEMGDIPYQTITWIAESPFKFGLIYVGTDDGNLHITRNGGKTWQKINKGLPYNKFTTGIVASKYDAATVYLALNGKRDDDFTAYVYKSTNYGRTWKSIAGNIPGSAVNVLREDPLNPKILYVGTDMGVYVTKDGGKKWHVLGSKLPITFVHDLIIHPRDNIIVIATHGRGMWALDANPINRPRGRRRRR